MPPTKILNNHDGITCDVCGKQIQAGDPVWLRFTWDKNDPSSVRRDGRRWCVSHGVDAIDNVHTNIFKRMYRKVRRRGN